MITRHLPRPVWDEGEVRRLAEMHGTPLYIYDLAQLSVTVETIWSILRPFGGSLYFATMANDRETVLRHLADARLGACVNSIPHLDLAISCGFDPRAIQFTSTGIRRDDMERLAQTGIRVNIDSITQLRQWFELGGRNAGLRVNAASLRGVSRGDRIGVEASDVNAALRIAEECAGTIDGIHVYVGTNFQDPSGMLPTLDAFFDLATRIPDLRYVNIGGGIGIDYSTTGLGFDLQMFGDHVAALVDGMQCRRASEVQVIVEPGRSVTASCAGYVLEITDRKTLNGTEYLAVDGSIAQFPRPFHHPETLHRVRVITRAEGAAAAGSIPATVVGRTTFSRDILGHSFIADTVRPGDYVLIENAGAYSQSMASRFLGQPAPAELFLQEGVPELIAAE